jgi:hypothetical protein
MIACPFEHVSHYGTESQFRVAAYVNIPPNSGPATDAIAHMLPMTPRISGFCRRGAL